MNVAEFKAWLDGFSEGIGEAPTPNQWARIKAQIDKLESPKPQAVQYAPPPPRGWLGPSPIGGPALVNEQNLKGYFGT